MHQWSATLGPGLGSLSAAACAGRLGGAAQEPGQPRGSSSATDSPAALFYLTFFGADDPQNVLFPHALQVFQQQYPRVNVEQTTTSGAAGNVMEKFVALVAGGTSPDIAAVNPQFLEPLRARGALADMTPYVKRDAKTFQPEDFNEATLLRAVRGGKWFALPLQMGLWFLFYNGVVLDQVGMGKPDASWDWNRQLEVARIARQRDPANLGMSMPPYELPIRANGGDILSADEKKCLLDQPPAVEAVQWMGDLRQRHRVVPMPDETAGQDVRRLFDTGRYVFHIGDPGFLSRTIRGKLSFAWDIAVVPRGKVSRVSTVKGPSLVMSGESKQRDLAWAWLAHYNGVEMQRYVGIEGKVISARKSALKAFVDTDEGYNKQAILETASLAKPMPYVARYDEMDKEIQAGLNAVFDGRQTAKDAMADAVRKVNELLAANPA